EAAPPTEEPALTTEASSAPADEANDRASNDDPRPTLDDDVEIDRSPLPPLEVPPAGGPIETGTSPTNHATPPPVASPRPTGTPGVRPTSPESDTLEDPADGSDTMPGDIDGGPESVELQDFIDDILTDHNSQRQDTR